MITPDHKYDLMKSILIAVPALSNVAHTIDQLIDAVGATYQAIDIRSVAIRKDISWLNVLAAVRFTYEDLLGNPTLGLMPSSQPGRT